MNEWQSKCIDLILFKIPQSKRLEAMVVKDAMYSGLYKTHIKKGISHIDLDYIYKTIYESLDQKYNQPKDASDWIKDGIL